MESKQLKNPEIEQAFKDGAYFCAIYCETNHELVFYATSNYAQIMDIVKVWSANWFCKMEYSIIKNWYAHVWDFVANCDPKIATYTVCNYTTKARNRAKKEYINNHIKQE